MDLAQSILKELITLQGKNEELSRIIIKLEHESDIIIKQFETKIEELQKSLKHEQDEKSRAARRYDAEIHELEERRDALINEISEVRNIFQTRAYQFEEKIQSLTVILEEKEKEIGVLIEDKNKLITIYEEKISSLLINLEDQAVASRHEQEILSSQARALAETLKLDHNRFTDQIKRNEEDIRNAGEALRVMDQRLHEYAEREKTLEEKSRETVDHLHLLINTERQIRTRELKERDLQEKEFEEQLKSSQKAYSDLEIILNKEISDAEHEISRLQNLLSDESLRRQRYEEESRTLSDNLSLIRQEYEEKLAQISSDFSRTKENLQDQISRQHEELRSTVASHAHALQNQEDKITALSHQRDELERTLRETSESKLLIQVELESKISQYEEEKIRFEGFISSAESDKVNLQIRAEELEITLRQEREKYKAEILLEREKLSESQQRYQREINHIRDNIKELGIERDHLLSERQAREDYYRDEISGLHQELADLQSSSRSQEEALQGDITNRDRQIQDLFTSNEALRAEIDRVRHQYIKLQETIRAEKEDSVHALYREITSLEEKLACRDRDNATLSENILRLDAENTRLIQQVSPIDQSSALLSNPSPSHIPVTQSKSAVHRVLESTPDLSDTRRKEVQILASELEDPARAADAAVKLAAMGQEIVDHLIPLLHTGSIQRRVWIAVVLYEINDNRATLPLMRLLETPKVHFRELIWEAKNQYHTRIRLAGQPAETVMRSNFI